MTRPILLRGGRVVDPSRFVDAVADVLVVDGKVEAVGARLADSATGRDGLETIDCSGLIVYVFRQVGVSLPHYTGALWGQGAPVSRGDLQPGDLVFFNGLGHAGIYAGGGSFVHAPHTGDVVKVSSLSDSWYASTYMGARRIP